MAKPDKDSLVSCHQSAWPFFESEPLSYSERAADRRSLPLEVFGTVLGGASTTSSGAISSCVVATSTILFLSASMSLRCGEARFDKQHEPLGACAPNGARKRGHASLAHTFQTADEFL